MSGTYRILSGPRPRLRGLALGALALAATALGALAQEARGPTIQEHAGWAYRVVRGETVPTEVIVRNVCLAAHDFRLTAPGTPWVRFDEPVGRLRVDGRSSRTVTLWFETAALEPGDHRGEVLVECLGCARERTVIEETGDAVAMRTCDSPPLRLPVEMTVLPAASPPGGTAPAESARPPAGEVRNIESSMRSRMADALARLAGKRGLTILPESLAVLSLPDAGLVAAAWLAGVESLSAAQLAAGAEVVFVHLELPAASADQPSPAGDYALLVRVGSTGAGGAAQLVDSRAGVVRDLALTSEPAGGVVVYAAELAPGIALPVWCSVTGGGAAPAAPSPVIWRGWPVRCLQNPS